VVTGSNPTGSFTFTGDLRGLQTQLLATCLVLCGWLLAAGEGLPERFRHKLHGVRQFHGCYFVRDGSLWGVGCNKKGIPWATRLWLTG
jgi:hypothetical protein